MMYLNAKANDVKILDYSNTLENITIYSNRMIEYKTTIPKIEISPLIYTTTPLKVNFKSYIKPEAFSQIKKFISENYNENHRYFNELNEDFMYPVENCFTAFLHYSNVTIILYKNEKEITKNFLCNLPDTLAFLRTNLLEISVKMRNILNIEETYSREIYSDKRLKEIMEPNIKRLKRQIKNMSE